MLMRVLAALACVLLLGGDAAAGSDRGWIVATVERVVDGDTFVIEGGDKVRVRNFDTPELRQARCADEKRAAHRATLAAKALLLGQKVGLALDGRDRYGRLVADVYLEGRSVWRFGRYGRSFTRAMIARGHGVPWRYGAEPKPLWCAIRLSARVEP